MKLHTLTGKPAMSGMIQPRRDQQPAAPAPQSDVVPFPGIPQSTLACAVLFAQFSTVLMANLVLMSSIAASCLAASRQTRVDH